MEGIRIKGMIGKAEIARPNRAMQSFFINGRYIKSKILTEAVEEAYKNVLTVNKYPVVVLHMDIHPTWVDVNVHPTKLEIKFSDEKQVYQAVYWAVKNALYAQKNIPEMVMPKQNLFEYHDDFLDNPGTVKVSAEKVEQQNIYGIKKDSGQPIGHNGIYNTYKDTYKDTYKENEQLGDEQKESFNDVHEEYLKVIGQIFDSYIIVQKGNEMLLIDQHAAHERIRYEQLKKQYNDGNLYSQVLLVPVVVSLSALEMEILKDNMIFFKNIGFEIEDFGNNSIMIRQAPISVEQQVLKDLFIELVEMLENTKNEKITETQSRALYTIACKAAVKANRPMHIREMEALVGEILKLENINTCPHGRPIIVSMSKYYLEKQFKRIQ